MVEEELGVQLQILNTTVKIYIMHPDNLIEKIALLFKTASENADNPDLRDRAFIYWRLLNLNDLEIAKEIILGEKPQIQEDENVGPVRPDLATLLISQIGLVTSILWDTEENLGIDIIEFTPEEVNIEEREGGSHKQSQPGSDKKDEKKDEKKKREKKKEEMMEKREIDQEDLLGIGIDEHATPSVQTPAGGNKGGFTDDLLNIGLNDEGSSMSHSPNNFNFGSQKQKNGDFGGLEDFMEVTSPVTSNSTLVGKNPLVEIVVPRNQPGLGGRNGLEISGAVQRTQSGLSLRLAFKNFLQSPIVFSQISVSPNSLKLTSNYSSNSCSVPAQGSTETSLPLGQTGLGVYSSILNLQLSSNYDNYMTGISIYPHVLSELSAPVTIDEFKQGWVVGQPFTLDQPIIPPILNNEESLKTIFKQNGINHLSTQLPSGNKKMYFGTRLITHEVALIELTVPSPTMIGGYQILIKSQSNTVSRSYSHSIALLLS